MWDDLTVLAEYQRLEAEGIWRPAPDAQRRDVIVSIGEATLTLSTANGTALTHWSLPAVVRLNRGEMPALYGPSRDPVETLEIADEEMVRAIDKVLRAIGRRRPPRGTVAGRGAKVVILAAAVFGLVFWLPGAITAYTAGLVPEVAKAQIGAQLLEETERVAGAPCAAPSGLRALERLTERLFPGSGTKLVVLPSTLKTTAHVPGDTILLSHTLVEDFEAPEVVAGYAIAEHLRMAGSNSLGELLEASPFRASLALLSSGRLREVDLQRMAEWLIVRPPDDVSHMAVLAALRDRDIAPAPYGYALDISGETTQALVSDTAAADPVLSDTDWIALQSICSE